MGFAPVDLRDGWVSAFEIAAARARVQMPILLACAENAYQSQFTRRLVGSIIGTECGIYYYIKSAN